MLAFRSGLTGRIIAKLRMVTVGHLSELPFASVPFSRALQVDP